MARASENSVQQTIVKTTCENKTVSVPECQWKKDWPHLPLTSPPGSSHSCHPSRFQAPAPSSATKKTHIISHLFSFQSVSVSQSHSHSQNWNRFSFLLSASHPPSPSCQMQSDLHVRAWVERGAEDCGEVSGKLGRDLVYVHPEASPRLLRTWNFVAWIGSLYCWNSRGTGCGEKQQHENSKKSSNKSKWIQAVANFLKYSNM